MRVLYGQRTSSRMRAASKTSESPTRTARPSLRGALGSAIRIGQFRVTKYGAGKCWIANSDGEGMATTEKKLAEHIGDYFKREF
jgi:hypothetical protein